MKLIPRGDSPRHDMRGAFLSWFMQAFDQLFVRRSPLPGPSLLAKQQRDEEFHRVDKSGRAGL